MFAPVEDSTVEPAQSTRLYDAAAAVAAPASVEVTLDHRPLRPGL